MRDHPRLIDEQDRAKLDFELPDELCRHVLSESNTRYVLADGRLRVATSQIPGIEMSTLEAFDRYGGSLLEEVHERGSVEAPE